MKILIILLILITPFCLSAKWESIKTPKENNPAEYMFNTGDTLIFITNDNIFVSYNNGESWDYEYNSMLYNKQHTLFYCQIEDVLYRIVYNSTYYTVFKSNDFGKTWSEFYLGEKLTRFDALYKNNDKYYFLSSKGLFMSSDHGKNWEKMSNENLPQSMKLIDNINDTIITADVGYRNSENKGVYISTDGGYSFQKRINGIESIDRKMFNFVKMYSDVAFIGSQQGLYYSNDLGENWTLANFAGSTNKFIRSFERVGDVFYVGTENGEIYKSNDISGKWEEVYNNFGKGRVYNIKNINGKIYFSTYDKVGGNYVLENNTYKPSNFVVRSVNSRQNIVNDSIYLLTYNNLYKSDKTLNNWEQITDFEEFQYNNLFTDGKKIILNYVADNKFLISNDNGKTWNEKTIGEMPLWVYDIFKYKNKLFVPTYQFSTNQFQLYFSEDYGKNWNNYNELNPDYNFGFRLFKEENGKLFCGTGNNGIVISNDDGLTWQKLSNDSTNLMFNENIGEYAINNDIIVVQVGDTYKLYRSTDLGKTWKEIEEVESNYIVKSLINYRENFFVITTSGFYYSKDAGETWIKYNEGIEDLLFSEIVYNVFEMKIFDGKLLLVYSNGIYTLPLSELGINYTSVESTESRNYLWTNAPYPQPSNNQVKVEVYWDSGLPFTSDDVEIYDLTGIKINTEGQINIIKESTWKGNIIWDASNQNPGIYIMKITHGTETRTRKILITE